MKKFILPVAAGQFILAAVLGYMCVQFRATTADSEQVEKQLYENCFALESALDKTHDSYSSSGIIVGNLSVQPRQLGRNMIKQSDLLRAILSAKKEKQLAEMGALCQETASVLDNYRVKTAPEVINALRKTADTLGQTGTLIKERHPYTRTARYVLCLGIAFIIICIFNGSLFIMFALGKTENNQKKDF